MSRKRSPEEYERSLAGRFSRWLNGEQDPYVGTVEMKPQKQEKPPEEDYVAIDYKEVRQDETKSENRRLILYRIGCTLVGILMAGMLIYAVSYLPPVGEADNPVNNEVAARYIEEGMEETANVNIVSGMILNYRAFDTFGESNVLFAATCVVMVILMLTSWQKENVTIVDHAEEHMDPILQKVVKILFPVIFLFGVYVVVNGHLSPGGGFSGGAIIGAGLILYEMAFGFEKTGKFLNAKSCRWITFIALAFYCLSKSYSFFTGANGIESIIPLGTVGNILSGGLTLPLNICVGAVVACTMYSFYALFRKGDY